MSARKKTGAKLATSGKRHRTAHQITLSPEATAIVQRWVDRAGEGTKSIHIDMAIRFAEKRRIFDDSLDGDESTEPVNLERAIAAHLPTLISRLAEHAIKNR